MDGMQNELTRVTIGAAVEVQRELGSGLLESAYCAALAIELSERGVQFAQEVPVSVKYKGKSLGVSYRADFIVQNVLIVEVKALEAVTEIHRAQLLSYLRLAGLPVGLLINFHAFPVASRGVHRLLNTQ
jgi:GxxExxY protein